MAQALDDYLASLEKRHYFLYLKGGGEVKADSLRTGRVWALSQEPSAVFALEPGEYHEVHLPVIPAGRSRYPRGAQNGESIMVKPCYDALRAAAAVPGAVTFEPSVPMCPYELPFEVHADICREGADGDAVEWGAFVASPEAPVAEELAVPVWHAATPRPEDAEVIADVVRRVGGRLALRRRTHFTHYAYRPLVDALAPHGIVVSRGAFEYDPKAAEKRLRRRKAVESARKRAPELAAARAEERRKADEDRAYRIRQSHIARFLHAVAEAFLRGAVSGACGAGFDAWGGDAVRVVIPAASATDYLRRIPHYYGMWVANGRHKSLHCGLPDYIGVNRAAAIKVVHALLDRLDRASDFMPRARACELRAVLKQVRAEVLPILNEVYEERPAALAVIVERQAELRAADGR